MTLLVDNSSTDPGTHVLVIGVGDYPYLKDGSSDPAVAFPLHMGMGQLSSPPLSVAALVQWLADPDVGMNNPDRPISSIEVLCSAADPLSLSVNGQPRVEIARANKQNVHDAVRDWKTRADSHKDNLLIFYFCGHGVAFSEAESSLLLEDFGEALLDPMSDAIDFDGFRLGLGQHCIAENQVFFLDACRTEPTNAFLDQFGDSNTGEAIVAGGLSRKLRGKAVPVYYAAGLGAYAYGQPGKPTLFTQGLLRAFRGSASREAGNDWEVVSGAIAEGVNKCVESLAFQKMPQYCQSREASRPLTLHRLRDAPEVVVKVSLSDQARLVDALLSCESMPPAPALKEKREPPSAAPWWLHLPRGVYAFSATSHIDQSAIGRREKHVAPPGAEVML